MTSIAFRGNTAIIRRQFSSLLAKVSANRAGNHLLGGYTSPIGAQNFTLRTFSHAEVGTIAPKLKKLDESTLRKIEDDLRKVDKGPDGR